MDRENALKARPLVCEGCGMVVEAGKNWSGTVTCCNGVRMIDVAEVSDDTLHETVERIIDRGQRPEFEGALGALLAEIGFRYPLPPERAERLYKRIREEIDRGD
jgi:hypothetical protein